MTVKAKVAALKVLLASDDQGKPGELPAFAWPGGYTMYYLTNGGDVLCHQCATRDLTDLLYNGQTTNDDSPVAYGALGATEDYPDDNLWCDDCGCVIHQADIGS
jgi:hypothetical protein